MTEGRTLVIRVTVIAAFKKKRGHWFRSRDTCIILLKPANMVSHAIRIEIEMGGAGGGGKGGGLQSEFVTMRSVIILREGKSILCDCDWEDGCQKHDEEEESRGGTHRGVSAMSRKRN